MHIAHIIIPNRRCTLELRYYIIINTCSQRFFLKSLRYNINTFIIIIFLRLSKDYRIQISLRLLLFSIRHVACIVHSMIIIVHCEIFS